MSAGPASAAPAALDGSSRFVVVTPSRLADTRLADCTCGRLDGSTIRVSIAGRSSVPVDAAAAALTLTVANASAEGYLTVWPSGRSRQETSVLNWDTGETRSNGAIVELGDAGSIDLYLSGGLDAADVIVDVSGVFVPVQDGTTGSGSGRFRTLGPDRVLDTRGGAPLQAGTTRRVGLPVGVPADAGALVINVTATDASASGYLTAFAAGTALPGTSTVNTDRAGQTRAATAIVPVSAQGIDLYSSAGSHALVDVVGWFTGDSAAPTAEGLFVPVAPTRLFDTRTAQAILDDGSIDMYGSTAPAAELLGQLSVATTAMAFNTTTTDAFDPGFLTAYPAATARPDTSTVNWDGGDTVANLTISATSTSGVSFYASTYTDVVVDLTGFFTGAPVAVSPPLPADAPVAQDPKVAAIVARAVPAAIVAALSDVRMQYLPLGEWRKNDDACANLLGATKTYTSVSSWEEPAEKITGQTLALARSLLTECPPGSSVPEGIAAHEVGHVLIDRWHFHPQDVAGQVQRHDAIAHLPSVTGTFDDGNECLAEAVARSLFEATGNGPYPSAYDGQYDSCATTAATRALASEVVNAT